MAGADITQFTRLDKLMQAAAGRTARQAAKPLEGDTGHIFMLGKIACEQLVDALRLQLAGMGFVLGSFQRHRLQAIFQLYLGTESHGLETDGLRTYLVRGLYGRALQRDLNSICMEARRTGIDCRDRDVNRFVYSKEVKEYHPFRQYMEWLPEWDGKDRVSDLARRVSSEPLWVEGFHRWMLALASQWMGSNRMHANSLAPILVSERPGCQKSTFCKSLMPSSLVRYYTDSVDLSASTQMEQKLGLFGLINLDEFDRLPDRKMALLKNWMQMAGMNVRKAHAKHFHPLPRLASFIGTTNQKNLLSAPTGSRRFLCVEVQSKINCEGIEHDQIYAQLKNELQKGERHWFTSAEEEAIMRSNEAFYKRPIEEDVFHACFRAACPGDLNVNAAVKPMSSKSSLALKSSLQLLICQHGDNRLSIRGQVRVRTREQGGDQMIHLFQG
mgnify:FL=1